MDKSRKDSRNSRAPRNNRLIQVLLLIALAAPSALKAETTIRLVTGEFQPYTSKDLPGGGPMTKLVRQALIEAGFKVEVSFLPWKRGYLETQRGTYHATFPYSFNSERAKRFLYSEPLRQRDVHIFALKQRQLTLKTLADLTGMNICTGLGYNVFPPIQKLLDQGKLEIQVVPEIQYCLNMIVQGRADATYLNEEVAWRLIQLHTEQPELFEAVGEPVYSVKESLIVSKSVEHSKQLIERFNSIIQRMKSDGRFNEIMGR